MDYGEEGNVEGRGGHAEGGMEGGGREEREDVQEMVVVRERKRCVVLGVKLYKCVPDPIEFTALKHGDCGHYLRFAFCTGTVIAFPAVPSAFLQSSGDVEHAHVTFMMLGRTYESMRSRYATV